MRLKILNEGFFDNTLNEDVSKYAGNIIDILRTIRSKLNLPNAGVYFLVWPKFMQLFTVQDNKILKIDDTSISKEQRAIESKFIDLGIRTKIFKNVYIYKEFEFVVYNDNTFSAQTRHSMYQPNEWFDVQIS